jgi:hypothetical protein
MGIYIDRHVEYIVILKNGSKITVTAASETDKRLFESAYYKNRRDNWLSEGTYNKKETNRDACFKIDSEDFDMKLTDGELYRLESIVNLYDTDVSSHGWYDVTSVTCTTLRK